MIIFKKCNNNELFKNLNGHCTLISPIVFRQLNSQMVETIFNKLTYEVVRKKNKDELDNIIITLKGKSLKQFLGSIALLLFLGYSEEEIMKILTNRFNEKYLNEFNLRGNTLKNLIQILNGMLKYTMMGIISFNFTNVDNSSQQNNYKKLDSVQEFFKFIYNLKEDKYGHKTRVMLEFLSILSKLYSLVYNNESELSVVEFNGLPLLGTVLSIDKLVNIGFIGSLTLMPIIKVRSGIVMIPVPDQTLIYIPKKVKIVTKLNSNVLNSLFDIREIKKDKIVVSLRHHSWVNNKGDEVKIKKILTPFMIIQNKKLYLAVYNSIDNSVIIIPIKKISKWDYEINVKSKTKIIISSYMKFPYIEAYMFFNKF